MWTHVTCSGPFSGGFPPPGLLTPLLAAARAAAERATLHAASTLDQSIQRPSLASEAATAWPNPSCWSVQARARAGVKRHAAGKNCSTFGTAPTAAVSHLVPDTACSHAALPLVHADE